MIDTVIAKVWMIRYVYYIHLYSPLCLYFFGLFFSHWKHFSIGILFQHNFKKKKTILHSYYQIIRASAIASFVWVRGVTRRCVVLKALIEALSDDILSFLAWNDYIWSDKEIFLESECRAEDTPCFWLVTHEVATSLKRPCFIRGAGEGHKSLRLSSLVQEVGVRGVLVPCKLTLPPSPYSKLGKLAPARLWKQLQVQK